MRLFIDWTKPAIKRKTRKKERRKKNSRDRDSGENKIRHGCIVQVEKTLDVVHVLRWKMKSNRETWKYVLLHGGSHCILLVAVSLERSTCGFGARFSVWRVCSVFSFRSCVFFVLFPWSACEYAGDDMSKVKTLLNNERSNLVILSHVMFALV